MQVKRVFGQAAEGHAERKLINMNIEEQNQEVRYLKVVVHNEDSIIDEGIVVLFEGDTCSFWYTDGEGMKKQIDSIDLHDMLYTHRE